MQKLTLILFFILIAGACNDEDLQTREFPRMETITFDLKSGGATGRGKLLVLGKSPITDHGFTWSQEFPTIQKSPKVSLGPIDKQGTFEVDIVDNFEKGKTYRVRAYAATADYVVYGQSLFIQVPL